MGGRSLIMLLLASFSIAATLAGQEKIEIDLAVRPPGTSFSVQRRLQGRIEVVVANALPNRGKYGYRVTVAASPVEVPNLPMPDPTAQQAADPLAHCTPTGSAAQASALAAIDAVYNADQELLLPSRYAAADTALRAVPRPCLTDNITERFRVMKAGMRFRTTPVEITSGQVVTVTITRITFPNPEGKGGSEVSSTYRFEPPPRGVWRTQYGFSFIGDRFERKQAFFSKAGPDEGQFTITEATRADRLEFVPTIAYSWLPSSASRSTVSYSAGAGLGFDLSKPVVFLAPLGVTFERNLTIQIGVAFASVDRLLSRYAVGEVIAENLTPEQLTQSVYRLNPFVSVIFGFGGNPFRGPQEGNGAVPPDK